VVLQISPNAVLCFAALMALQLVPMFGTVAALGFLAFAMAFVSRRPSAVPGEVLGQPLLWAMVGWCVLSVLWSDYPGISLRHGLQLAFTVLFATAIAARMPPLVLLKALAVSFLVACAASLASGRARADGEGFLGIYASKNAMAAASSILLLIGLCLIVDRRLPPHWRVLGAASVGLGGLLLVRANSVGAAATMVVVSAVLVMLLALRRLSGAQRLVAGALSVLAVAGAGLVLMANFDGVAMMFLDATGKDMSLTGRTDLWQVALDEIAARPWLGAGYQAVWVPGNPIAEMLWTDFGVESRTGFHFHNAYLSNAVEIGLVGVLLQVALVMGGLIGALAWVVNDLRAETLFMALFMVRQVLLSLVEVPFFLQFDIGTIVTVAILVYLSRLRQARP
jgi:exopolysaccharide production protein ExoQ